ncbi:MULTISPECIES: ATP-binding protein [unclassified Variovorax]|uniref:ATP-binding protein n=1 Tax=unclassified Variovorax TaxID=663243 RepID=UPI003F45DE6F
MSTTNVNEPIDLGNLLVRESEQVEWKENVADPDDVVATLCAFANDWSNLGGGYVVCGAEEGKDAHGFPSVAITGLEAARLKEIEGRVLTGCRDRVSPSIAPLVHEIPTTDPTRRVLVFVMPANPKAHTFRRGTDSGKHYVRISRETREARDGILRTLLVRKNEIEPWDRRVCGSATTNDLDLVALRDALQRMNVFDPKRGIDDYLSDTHALSPFVPPLCGRDPLTGQLRPRNFAMLLFGRQVQAHVPGAYSLVSIYPGHDRSEPHAERHELDGTIIDQARRAIAILGVQSYIAFDKTSERSPNVLKYPRQALTEAMVNALAHRDYELPDPARTTVFADRIEIASPGGLPLGVKLEVLREGKSGSRWRNQSLAWFLSRLQLAQAEGQGIPTIIRSMREEGCPDPRFDEDDDARVICTLPAHPRHALAREYRQIEEAISLGEFELAKSRVQALLVDDGMNTRAVQLLAEIAGALKEPNLVRSYLTEHEDGVSALPPRALLQLAEALTMQQNPGRPDFDIARRLYLYASKGLSDEREVRKVAYGLSRAGDDHGAVAFIDKQLGEHPEWRDNAFLLQARGNSYIGMAKQCTRTARRDGLPPQAKTRAWEDGKRFLGLALKDLEAALNTSDAFLRQTVQKNIEFAEDLLRRVLAGRPQGGPRHGRR